MRVCGAAACVNGATTLRDRAHPGINLDGAFAEFVVVSAGNVKLPDALQVGAIPTRARRSTTLKVPVEQKKVAVVGGIGALCGEVPSSAPSTSTSSTSPTRRWPAPAPG